MSASQQAHPAVLPHPSRPAPQEGILEERPPHVRLVAFDVLTPSRAALHDVLATWSALADELRADWRRTGLMITFGLGPGIFDRRFGLAARRPAALVPAPVGPGDRLEPQRCDGDLLVQVCGEDERAVAIVSGALAGAVGAHAAPRWVQSGRRGPLGPDGLPRSPLGFADGVSNVQADDDRGLRRHLWADGPSWMAGGTYLVVRRARLALDAWDDLSCEQQERVVGRRRGTGRRLPDAPASSHATLAAGAAHGSGARLLRRNCPYDDGYDEDGRRDAGLLVCCFAKDVAQFAAVHAALAAGGDALSAYAVHTASAVFAIPPAPRPGGVLAEAIL